MQFGKNKEARQAKAKKRKEYALQTEAHQERITKYQGSKRSTQERSLPDPMCCASGGYA
jgi:hypothetical protein